MLIQHGEVSSLAGRDWFVLELRSEATAEIALRRLSQEIPGIFRESPVEVFVPVKRRDLDAYELFTGPYIYVRSENFKAVLRIKTITGLVGLVTEGDSGRSIQAIPAPDDFVQDLVAQDAEAFENRSEGVGIGSFVRILDGNVRDFCGIVTKLKGRRADVVCELKTKKLFVSTPVKNLLNLDHVPKEKRVFYYSPLVEDLDDASLVKQDRHTLPEVIYTEVEMTGQEVDEHQVPIPRSSSISNFLRRQAKLGKTPMEMLEAVVGALAKGVIKKRPKNLSILYFILKAEWLAANAGYGHWREVGRKLPKKDYVVVEEVFRVAEKAKLGIQRHTREEDKPDDGRRSYRRRAKLKS